MIASNRRKILFTGAAGRIGTAFFESAKDQYTFLLADKDSKAESLRVEPPHHTHDLDGSDRDS